MRGIVTDMNTVTEWGIELIPEDGRLSIASLRSRLSELPRDREILVVCRSGQRAYYATRILMQSGFKAKNISGGMLSRAMRAISETK